MSTNKTTLIRRIVAIVIILGGSLAIAVYMKSRKEPPRKKAERVAQNVVEVMAFTPGDEKIVVPVSGRIQAKNKIEVLSQVTGTLLSGSKPFKEGNSFAKGQILMRLDDTDARMAVVAQRSTFQTNLTLLLADIKIDHADEFAGWNTYAGKLDPEKDLPELPEVKSSHLKNFLVAKGIYQLYYQIQASEAHLRKFVLIAPFNGILASANVTEGEVIRAGQPVGVFLQADHYEMEVGLSLLDKEKVKAGNEVTLRATDKPGTWNGKVARISESIDPGTQTVKVYIDVTGSGLYDGMYLSGKLYAGTAGGVMRYPSNLVTESNEVYIVNDSVLNAVKAEVIHREGQTVLLSGIPEGAQLVASTVPGIYDGMIVKLKNR